MLADQNMIRRNESYFSVLRARCQYVEDVVEAATNGRIGDRHLRAAVQCAASLPLDSAIELLSKATLSSPATAAIEAGIYATDKLVKQYLLSGCPIIDLLEVKPYGRFFSDPKLASWQQVARVLGFAAQIGPDNTHPDEYSNAFAALNRALDAILLAPSWPPGHAHGIVEILMRDCDRLLFNATPESIFQFFNDARRAELGKILDRIAIGHILAESDLAVMRPYIQSLETEVQYHVCHVLFVLSSCNDLEGTLRLLEGALRASTSSSSPYEIDFLQGAVVYLHLVHNLLYDEERFAWVEDLILREWRDLLLFSPGLVRGERRGFSDLFDRVFEDGFGVVYPYGYLRPALRRRFSHYGDYRHAIEVERASQLPLYTHRLEECLRTDRVEEALQILQAMAAVIVVWPTEGLSALRTVVGHSEPRIRRAVIRILAEAFNRHPDETLLFLKTSGAIVSDDDLAEIKVRQDARIGRRQINEVEWGRIAHFLLNRPDGRAKAVECLRIIVSAATIDEAVLSVLQILRLVYSAAR
jgi:hypothetical protein